MRFRFIIYPLLAAVLCISCNKSDVGDERGLKHIGFSAAISAAPDYSVKAIDGSQFGVGTHYMGLWVCNGAETPSHLSPILNEFKNCRIEYSLYEDNSEQWNFYGNGRSWSNSIAVDNGTAVDIYSYYPWDESITDITSIPFASGCTDYLWCAPVILSEEQTTGDDVLDVTLNYRHVMTCIEVSVKANANNAIKMDELTLADITGSNIAASGTFNAATGEVNISSGTMTDTLSFTNGGNGVMLANDDTTPRISFIFPEYENYSADNFELSFKFNGIEGATKFKVPSSITGTGKLEAGKKYIVNLQLNEAMKFTVADFKTTDDWNDEIYQTDIVL